MRDLNDALLSGACQSRMPFPQQLSYHHATFVWCAFIRGKIWISSDSRLDSTQQFQKEFDNFYFEGLSGPLQLCASGRVSETFLTHAPLCN